MIGIGKGQKVRVASSALNKAGTGSMQAAITFEDEAGETITAYLSFAEKADKYTRAKLKALGYDLDEHDNDPLPLNLGTASPIVGVETVIDVVEHTYDNKTSAKVDDIGDVLKNMAVGGNPMPEDEAAAFAALYRQQSIARKGTMVTPASAPATKAAAKPAAAKPAAARPV